MGLIVRNATQHDVIALEALNHAAYPDLVAAGVVYEARQLQEQLRAFGPGQRVAVDGGRIVGAISTLIVPERAALAPHTWIDITDCGRFGTHAPGGDTLYLADIYVHPSSRGRGVGSALYGALRDLCRAHGLRRIVGGGRLWSYHEVVKSMTPDAYVSAVQSGLRYDAVLTSQLRQGFQVRGIMPAYLDDWRSAGFATLIDWPNNAVIASGAAARSRELAVFRHP
jgi:GNAT superfamily N-acetyltransferase